MPKSLERLIELLPLPILLAAAAIFSLAWLVKELRPHTEYGPVLRDKLFQRGTGVVVGVLVLSFLVQIAFDRLRAPNFHGGERGICVAEFEGDKDDVVQRQTTEFLRSLFASDDTLVSIRVERYSVVPTSHEEARAIAEKHGAVATIWGSVIPGAGANMVEFNLSTRDQKRETRKLCPQYPDIRDFTAAIAKFMRASVPLVASGGENAQANYLNGQLQELRAENERLSNAVSQLQRSFNASLIVRSAEMPSTSAASTENRSPLIPPKRFGLFIGIDRYPQLGSNLMFPTRDVIDMASAFRSGPNSSAVILNSADATRLSVTAEMDRITHEVGPNDQVWLYFSGTGFQKQESGYLALSDTSTANLLAN